MKAIDRRRAAFVSIGLGALLLGSVGLRSDAGGYFVSPAGRDTNPCSAALPCREIGRALELVTPGDTVHVADGVYAGFELSGLQGKPDSPITIKADGKGAVVAPAASGRDEDTIRVTSSSHVVIDGLRSSGSRGAAVRVDGSASVTIRGGVFGDNALACVLATSSDDLRLDANECHGSRLHGVDVNGGQRVVVRGNKIHANVGSGIRLAAGAGDEGIVRGALIENNVVFGNGARGAGAIGLEGVQASIVRNNLLYENRSDGIVAERREAAAGPSGLSILHNTVDMPARGGWALAFRDSAGPNLVRNNVLLSQSARRGGILLGDAGDAANLDSGFNLLERLGADGGAALVPLAEWQAGGREEGSLSAARDELWADPGSADYSLRPRSPAIDRGARLSAAPLDIASVSRPHGPAPDLGAYEAEANAVPAGFVDDLFASGIASPTAMALRARRAALRGAAGRPAARHQERHAARRRRS